MPSTKPMIPYIRQSRKKEETISLDEQRRDIERWAKNAGVKLAKPIIEQGVSGKKHWRERELGAAFAAVQDGKAAGIIVAYQSRLSRESGLGTAEVWDALSAAGARLVCVYENIDTARHDDQEFNFAIQAAVARQEWKRHKRNWEKANRVCTENGIYQGPLPTGFSKGRKHSLKGTEAKHASKQLTRNGAADGIEEAFKMRASGGSWSETARVLQAHGVRTPGGEERWGVNSVRSLVANSIYKGVISNGHEHHFAEYAIVAPSIWKAAQGKTGTGPGRKDGGRWAVLGGLLLCGGCNHRMTPTHTKRTSNGGETLHRYYQCKSITCDARAMIRADEVEPYVTETAFGWLEAHGPRTTGRDADNAQLAELEIARDEERRRFAAWEASSDPLDPGYAERKAELREKVQAAEAALLDEQKAGRVVIAPEELRDAYEAADTDERRALNRKMLLGATVRKGREPAAERVEVRVNPTPWEGAAAG